MDEIKLQALIGVLIDKGIITEKEIKAKEERLLRLKHEYYENDLDYHTY
ncbi:hypothetical protein [Clostridium botulinum]|nr:hypothetical protein [Clostridium botulinum]MDU4596471.1 hypothetical protein [Clostridium sporogenes]WGZ48105.1 hypothetical protein HEQ52_18335 [Clostridium botulinum]